MSDYYNPIEQVEEKKPQQKLLFGKIEDFEHNWQNEWQDMPEFVQEDKWEYQAIIVRFNSEEDVNNFAKLIEQSIHPTTQSIWYPQINIENKSVGMDSSKRCVDES